MMLRGILLGLLLLFSSCERQGGEEGRKGGVPSAGRLAFLGRAPAVLSLPPLTAVVEGKVTTLRYPEVTSVTLVRIGPEGLNLPLWEPWFTVEMPPAFLPYVEEWVAAPYPVYTTKWVLGDEEHFVTAWHFLGFNAAPGTTTAEGKKRFLFFFPPALTGLSSPPLTHVNGMAFVRKPPGWQGCMIVGGERYPARIGRVATTEEEAARACEEALTWYRSQVPEVCLEYELRYERTFQSYATRTTEFRENSPNYFILPSRDLEFEFFKELAGSEGYLGLCQEQYNTPLVELFDPYSVVTGNLWPNLYGAYAWGEWLYNLWMQAWKSPTPDPELIAFLEDYFYPPHTEIPSLGPLFIYTNLIPITACADLSQEQSLEPDNWFAQTFAQRYIDFFCDNLPECKQWYSTESLASLLSSIPLRETRLYCPSNYPLAVVLLWSLIPTFIDELILELIPTVPRVPDTTCRHLHELFDYDLSLRMGCKLAFTPDPERRKEVAQSLASAMTPLAPTSFTLPHYLEMGKSFAELEGRLWK